MDRSQIVYQKNSDVFKLMSKNIIYTSCYLFNANDLSISGVITDCYNRTSRLFGFIRVTENKNINTILSYSVGRFFTIISFLM